MERIVDKIEALSKFFAVWRRFRRRLRHPIFWKRIWKTWWRILKKERARKVFVEAIGFFTATIVCLWLWVKMSIAGDPGAFTWTLLAAFTFVVHLSALARLATPLEEADQAVAKIVRKHHDKEEQARSAAAINPERREPGTVRRRHY